MENIEKFRKCISFFSMSNFSQNSLYLSILKERCFDEYLLNIINDSFMQDFEKYYNTEKKLKRELSLYYKEKKIIEDLATLIYKNYKGKKNTYFKLLKKSAYLGNVNAIFELGCYYGGEGKKCTKKDYERAFEWFEKVANKGDPSIRYKLIVFLHKISLKDIDFANAYFKYFQKHFNIKNPEEFDENNLEHTIKLYLFDCYSSFYNIRSLKQLEQYTKTIENFFNKNNFGEFKKDYYLERKFCGSDLGLTITKKSYNKKYFLKLYPYNKEKYKEKLMELEYFRLLGEENSMKVFDLYINKNEENGCIVFYSEQALTGKFEQFPKFNFKEFRGLRGEDLKINQQFKNLNQFFKIIIYSMMLNLGDVRDTNVLMALEEQDKNKDIRIKLIDFWLARCGNVEELPNEIKVKKIDGKREIEIIIGSPFLLGNISNNSLSQIFLKQCIYLFLLAQYRNMVRTTSCLYACNVITDILEFIEENPEIIEIFNEKVNEYIGEVFNKVKNLSEDLNKNLTKEKEEVDNIKLELLKVRIDILKQFSERYKYLEEKLKLKTIQKEKNEKELGESFEELTSIIISSSEAIDGTKKQKTNIKLQDKTNELKEIDEVVKNAEDIIEKIEKNIIKLPVAKMGAQVISIN